MNVTDASEGQAAEKWITPGAATTLTAKSPLIGELGICVAIGHGPKYPAQVMGSEFIRDMTQIRAGSEMAVDPLLSVTFAWI
jgi:hypothetical protein